MSVKGYSTECTWGWSSPHIKHKFGRNRSRTPVTSLICRYATFAYHTELVLLLTFALLYFLGNVSRWERTVNDEEERLESAKKQEQKQRDDIDRDLRQVDELKAERLSKKQECDNMEDEVGKARRDVGAIAKDVQASQKQVLSLEAKIEGKKNDRHNILMQCKVS